MPRSATVLISLAFATLGHTRDEATKRASSLDEAESPHETLADRFLTRSLRATRVAGGALLDNATLGKPATALGVRAAPGTLGAATALRAVAGLGARVSPACKAPHWARTGFQAQPPSTAGQRGYQVHAVLGRSASAQGSFKVNVPKNEGEMLSQVHTAVQAALSDGKCLLEVEMPLTVGIGVGTGDSIAISEYNANQQLLRRFCALWEWLGREQSVRVFFPDAAEASIAMNGAGVNPVSGQWAQPASFHDWAGEIDYLMRDDLFSQASRKSYGIKDLPPEMAGKMRVEENTEIDDRLYVIGYPYDNTDELVNVMKLWQTHARPTVIFNGNLDNARTTWFPPWGDGKELQNDFLPQVEAAYYIHYFKAARPGALVRAYPGPWRVLRLHEDGYGYECVKEYAERPPLREVALEWFSGGLNTAKISQVLGPVEPLSDDNQRYYEVLGIARNTTREDITMAYRHKARELHPDNGGDPMVFYELSKAYAVLKDAESRALYDVHGEKWVDIRDAPKATGKKAR